MEDDQEITKEETTSAYRRNIEKADHELNDLDKPASVISASNSTDSRNTDKAEHGLDELDKPVSVTSTSTKDHFGLRRRLGLTHAISWNVGSMIGSGIFLAPKGVLASAGSVGSSLIVWTLCGVISMMGGLCYAELGVVLGKSGGEFAYLIECYGGAISFMYLAAQIGISMGSGSAVGATTCGEYLAGTFIQDHCESSPNVLVTGIACLVIGVGLGLNMYSVPLVKRIQLGCTVAKVAALIGIIIGGLVHLFQGNTENFDNAFEGSETNLGKIALSFYSGMWAYIGWNAVGNVTEEITNVKRNVPLSIILGVAIVTIIYVLTNVSYFAILSADEILASNAVALSWAEQLIPKFAWIVSLSVAISTFGSNVGGIFASSRVLYRSSRDEQLPSILGMIHCRKYIPMAACLFYVMLAYLYLIPGDVQLLMDMVVFVTWTTIGACCGGVIVLRYTRKDTPRPFKVPIPIPVIMVCLSLYFLIAPIVDDPRWIYLVGLGVLFGSLIFYFPLVYYKLRVPCMDPITKYLQLSLQLAPSEISDEEIRRAAHG